MRQKGRFGLGFLMGFLVALVLIAGIGIGIVISVFNGNGTTLSKQTSAKMNLIEQVIDKYYFGEVNKSKLKEGVYGGEVKGLDDKYSVYYTKEEYKSMMEETSGEYAGMGAQVSEDLNTGVKSVAKVFKGSPAEKAGIQNGDVLVAVNDKDITDTELNKVVLMIKGKPGTKVKVKVYRKSTNKYYNVTITRAKIDVPSVGGKIIDKKNKMAYVGIVEFNENTAEQFKKTIETLKKSGAKGFIIDVRGNPGGLYDSVCKILDELLPKGTIVSTKDKEGHEEKETSDAKYLNMPIVVLQNSTSASASEIFAGAIQDYGVGKIVGEKSYGKGVVQQIFPLSDGTALKLTIKKYYTPKGRDINLKGITPDVVVEAKQGKLDNQYEKAKKVLLGEMKK